MEEISVFTSWPSSINNGTIKSSGVKCVSETSDLIADDLRKILFLLGKYIFKAFEVLLSIHLNV